MAQLEHERARDSAFGTEIIRRSFIWAGLLMGSAIVLKDLITATDFVYLMLVFVTAWGFDQRTFPQAGKWADPLAAAAIIIVASILKLVMEW